MKKVLIFGSSGSLGKEISKHLSRQGFDVSTASRSPKTALEIDISNENWQDTIPSEIRFDAIVWAQGMNSSGSVLDTTDSLLIEVFTANVGFVATTLRKLVEADLLANPSRAVVLSSIWQTEARADKFAYLVSKSALSGLIKSISIDMAPRGLTINGILPGVIDTPMTRQFLGADKVKGIERDSAGGSLATPEQIAKSVEFLIGESSSGISGQFIKVDNGWSINRHV
jgi:NAD(P)-dependent dehydrogenase (short-subunit alcohol dehydrogenase family)